MEQLKFCKVPVDISISDTGGTEEVHQYKFCQNSCVSGPNSERQSSSERGRWRCGLL